MLLIHVHAYLPLIKSRQGCVIGDLIAATAATLSNNNSTKLAPATATT
jgi:hypothetical protein